MPARRIVLIVVGSALACLLALGLLVVGIAAVLPHPKTAAQLLARPEGKLVYPGSVLLAIEQRNETDPLFEGANGASVIRRLATPDPIGSVVSWYDNRLKALGYAQVSTSTRYTGWSRGSSQFALTYGRIAAALPGPPGPPGDQVFVASFSVDPGSG
jgi:hypothetical protein